MNREQMVEKAAQALANVENGGNVEGSDRDVAAVILDAILPQVTTVAELEALPDEAVLVTSHGYAGTIAKFLNWTEPDFTEIGPLTVVWQPGVKS